MSNQLNELQSQLARLKESCAVLQENNRIMESAIKATRQATLELDAATVGIRDALK